jgi:hypothetical protein
MTRAARGATTLTILLTLAFAAGPARAAEMGALAYLPGDAVGAVALQVDDLGDTFEEIVGFLADLEPDTDREAQLAPLRAWEQQLGFGLGDGLLAHVGPDMAVGLSVENLDELLGGSSEAAFLEGLVFAAGVRDAESFEAGLRVVLGFAGMGLHVGDDGWRTVRAVSGDAPSVHYRLHAGFVVAGFSRNAVDAALLDAGAGGLASATDWLAVSSQLRPSPDRIVYVNVPRIVELLEGSEQVQAEVERDPGFAHIYRMFVVDPGWDRGAAWLSYAVDGGTVRQSFVPMEGILAELGSMPLTSMFLGGFPLHAGMSILENAVPEPAGTAAVTHTMADIRSIATACEAYGIDNSVYPGPTGGYVDVTWLLDHVQPVYIRELPFVDGWGNGLLYWSDGESYVVLSTGSDGVRDWQHGDDTSGTSDNPARDIVFRNGVFHRWPASVD